MRTSPLFAASAIAIAMTLLSACSGANAPNAASADTRTDARQPAVPVQAGDSYYQSAASAVAARAYRADGERARNVILFIGDGMGLSTITAARIYAGQKRGVDGESYSLTFETLPHVALSKTYAHDGQVSDSASTATALLTGSKTNLRTLGLTQGARFGNCASMAGNGTDSIFDLAERAGLATGLVSTARLTHATPAAAYSQSVSRDFEDNTDYPGDTVPEGCPDIATQLVEWDEGDGLEVALGGGRRSFLPQDITDPEVEGGTGRRTDGRDLANQWTRLSNDHRVIYGQAGFNATNFDSDTRVLGLFEPSHMQYEMDRASDVMGEPSLAEMTRAAITRLSRDEDGYILMVEAGRIDHAHHSTNAARALEDTDALDLAVATALEMTSAEDTLIIVTADHSHTLTLAGYPARNNPILGKVAYGTGAVALGADGRPYTTLGYANGPSAPCAVTSDPAQPCQRPDLSDVDTTAPDFQQQALVPMPSETHAGEDVPIFASGPGSAMIDGMMEQNEVFHVMGYATGLVARPD